MGIARAIAAKFDQEAEKVETSRAEFNYRSIESKVPRGSKVLDVGAWKCYLSGLLRDRLDCNVLSLDVVDVNQTDVPFRMFDGQTLPVESNSFDVILLLYVLHHAADDQPLLREAHRTLRDGGVLLVAEDSVDGLWNRMVTVGFHIYLWMVTRMGRDGEFRTTSEWKKRFGELGFKVKETIPLGHHLGRTLWPRNTLFVLGKDR
jgi:SAM-dependent methyltransferase